MVKEEIEIQTLEEVQQIDHRREISDLVDNKLSETNENMSVISSQLNNITSTIDNINVDNVNVDEITNKLDEFDTTMITTQNQDILETLNNQQTQINSIEEKINIILNKIDEM